MVSASRRRLASLLLAATIAGTTAACGSEETHPTATPIGRSGAGSQPAANQAPGDDRHVTVIISDGKFSEERYTARTGGQISLLVTTTKGGAQTLAIDGVGQSYVLQEHGTNRFAFDAPPPGDYPMRLSTGATATLTIRP